MCQFPADSDCQSSGGVCPVGLVCAADQRCRKSCQTAAECLAGQGCSTSGACADSNDLDGNGQIVESGVGVVCVTSAGCNSSLTCAMNRCHYSCQSTNLCPSGQSCVNTGSGPVCQLPVEALCDGSVPCPGGLVCAVDYRCRAPCGSASDCTPGQKCAGDVCADSGDLNPSGQIPPKSPPVISRDAGVDVPATGVGGDGGVGKDGAGGAIDAGSPISTGGTGGSRIDGAPGTGGVSAGGSGGSTGGSGGARDGGAADAPPDRPADTAIGRDVPLGPDVPRVLDGGGSTVLTGCGKVTTQRYFCDDFEGGLDNWHHATEGWGLTDKTYQSPGYSVTDSPNGNYPVWAKSEITMVGPVDLTSAVSPILTFWHRLSLYSCSDSVYVDVSSDGGTTWTVLASFTYADAGSGWRFWQHSLAAYVGKKVKLRFRLVDDGSSGCSGVADGWYLDDVEIREADLPPSGSSEGRSTLLGSAETTGCGGTVVGTRYFCEDFESDLAGWLVATEGWNTVAATSQSPTHSVTDSPNGNYSVWAKSEITMAGLVDLTSAVSPILTFWHRLSLYSCSDSVYVDVSSDGGTAWTVLASFTYADAGSVWSFRQHSLAAYVGKKVKLRFRLVDDGSSGCSGVADGWYLDDIKIRENEFVPAPSDLALCSSQAAGAACNAADLSRKDLWSGQQRQQEPDLLRCQVRRERLHIPAYRRLLLLPGRRGRGLPIGDQGWPSLHGHGLPGLRRHDWNGLHGRKRQGTAGVLRVLRRQVVVRHTERVALLPQPGGHRRHRAGKLQLTCVRMSLLAGSNVGLEKASPSPYDRDHAHRSRNPRRGKAPAAAGSAACDRGSPGRAFHGG